jgi:hypothetical protein
MKIIITEAQLNQLINEDIRPMEADNNYKSVLTVAQGKRNISAITTIEDDEQREILILIGKNKLKILKVPSNPYNMWIVYRDGFLKQAEELKNIVDRNGGFLTGNLEDQYRIGKLLEYNEEDILKFIEDKRNGKLGYE